MRRSTSALCVAAVSVIFPLHGCTSHSDDGADDAAAGSPSRGGAASSAGRGGAAAGAEAGSAGNRGGEAGVLGGVGGAGSGGASGNSAGSASGAGAGGSSAGGAGGSGGSAGATTGASGSGAGGVGGEAGNPGASGSGGAAGNGGASGSAAGGGSGGAGGRGGVGGGAGGSGGVGGVAGAAGSGGGASYNPCPPSGQPCKVLPLGDSITDGYNVPGGYRIELFRLANSAGKSLTFVGSSANGPAMVNDVAFPRNHEGHSGFTIDRSAAREGILPLVDAVMSAHRPHIVTLMIGTNDVDLNVELADAPERLGSLLDRIQAADPNVLLVVAQLVPSQTESLNVRVRSYNAAIPALIQTRAQAGRHIVLVDMYTAFTSNPSFATALLADNLHPNAAGHTRLAQTWYAAIGGLLR